MTIDDKNREEKLLYDINPIQDGPFCICSRMRGGGGVGKKKPYPFCYTLNLSHISCNGKNCQSYKNIWITWHTPRVLLISEFFHQKSTALIISRNTDINCMLIHHFNSFNLFWVFKHCFNKYGYNFDDASKTGHCRSS